jgi:hypothetical protein
MYNSIDGKQAGILKNVGSTASDSIYSHKDSVTVSNGAAWQYAKTPKFKEPVAINSPRCSPIGINPDYLKIAKIAYDTVLQTMIDGEKEHGADEWKNIEPWEHLNHAMQHLTAKAMRDKGEDRISHAMTRCAMIKYLEAEVQLSAINSHEEHEV